MSSDMKGTATLLHTSGSLVVGYLLAWGLYGVLVLQVYIYYVAFPHDKMFSKLLVGVVFLLETLQVVIIARDMFETFAKGFGDPNAIFSLHLSGLSAPIIAGTVGLMVQIFYAYRIRILSESNIVPAIICFLAVVQCVGAYISGINGFIVGDVRHLHSLLDRLGHGLFNATCAVCDIVIAIWMSYYLPKLNSGSRRSTNILLSRIIWIVVGTGSLTAVVAIVDQIVFAAFPGKGYFLAPAFVLGKLYSNSMMVVFNSRVKFNGVVSDTSTLTSSFRRRNTTNIDHDVGIAQMMSDVHLDTFPRKVDPAYYAERAVINVHRVQERHEES